MPEINEYISIMNTVKETELPKSMILAAIDSEQLTVNTEIVPNRTMILRTSLDTWFADYLLAQRGLADVLSEGLEMVDGVNDYLVATYKQVTDVEFTDIDDDPRTLMNAGEFYQSVLDTATILVD